MAVHQCCHPNMVATSGITSNNYLCSHKLIRTRFPHTYATMALHQFYHVCLVCLFVALHHFFAFKLGDFFWGAAICLQGCHSFPRLQANCSPWPRCPSP